jgi:hypothetical protein
MANCPPVRYYLKKFGEKRSGSQGRKNELKKENRDFNFPQPIPQCHEKSDLLPLYGAQKTGYKDRPRNASTPPIPGWNIPKGIPKVKNFYRPKNIFFSGGRKIDIERFWTRIFPR